MPEPKGRPTPKRPNLSRKVTPASEAKRNADLDGSESIRVDGVVYTIRPADITGLMERDIRRAIGMSLGGLMEQMYSDPGLDSFAAFLWIANMQAGKDSTYEEALASLNYLSEIESDTSEEEATPVPEA